MRPSVADAKGSGTQRRYSYRDLVELKVVKSLLDAGVSLQTARKAIEYLREHLGEDLASRAASCSTAPTRCSCAPATRSSTSCATARACSTSCRSAGRRRRSTRELDARRRGERVTDGDAAPRGRAGRGAEPSTAQPLPHEQVRFAHNSERQFAKLLDFYGIEWEYEPRTFMLERDRDGNPVQAFTPDFYLPAYDLYIEITTLNQKLVTKKNRKARRLRELHPDVHDPGALPARLPAPAREVRPRAAVAARRRRRDGEARAAAARPRRRAASPAPTSAAAETAT